MTVKVMPNEALYWYGNMLENEWIEGGVYRSFTRTEFNKNSFSQSVGNGNYFGYAICSKRQEFAGRKMKILGDFSLLRSISADAPTISFRVAQDYNDNINPTQFVSIPSSYLETVDGNVLPRIPSDEGFPADTFGIQVVRVSELELIRTSKDVSFHEVAMEGRGEGYFVILNQCGNMSSEIKAVYFE